MGEKTFSDRVRQHASEFSKIYEELSADYERGLKATLESDLDYPSDPWRYLFNLPIETVQTRVAQSPPTTAKDERESIASLFADPSLQSAVMETARRLKLANLRLGPVTTNDPRIGYAKTLGLLTYDDLEPLYKMSKADQLSRGRYYVTRYTADGSDPFVWRTLLEILCRTFLAPPGTQKWTRKQTLQLGFDLIDINRRLEKNGEKFSIDKAHKKLNSGRGLFKTKYPDGVGRERIEKLMKDVGPMNKHFFSGLKRVFKKEFSGELDTFLNPKPKTLQEVEALLVRVGKMMPRD